MKPDAIKVGLRINFIRKKLGLTMQEFGHKVSNSPRSTVIEYDCTEFVRVEKLKNNQFKESDFDGNS